ncbi:MAG: MBL fold metallo-hydrolase [Actinomycetota bacterium]
MDVIVIDTPQLGDRSYLVHDGTVALVIDPQRDTDRVEEAARDAGVRITHVAETHLHNDYVTGGLVLARSQGAVYLVNAADSVSFERQPIADGETIPVGSLLVRAVATPGHTHTHLSYIVTAGDDRAVFSGGSLLYGSVGRTDLVAADDTVPLSHDQYTSVRRLVEEAGREAALYPTHGFGSFCSSGPSSGASASTVAEQIEANHALTDSDEDHFVEELIANLTAYPSYYAHMSPENAIGPSPADLTIPGSLDPEELSRRLTKGEWVADLRNRVAFATTHLEGTVSFEYGDGSSFTTYLGWILPWKTNLTLVGSRTDVANAIRDLSRIGIDSPNAAVGTDPASLAASTTQVTSYPRVSWEGMLAERPESESILDVRRTDEYDAAHIPGAVNIPLHELLARMGEIPAGRLWVHCGSGYRAGIASSLLHRGGKTPVHIDALFADAPAAGVDVTAD